MPFALFKYSSLSYIVLALSSAGTDLSNKTFNWLSMTFKDRQLNSMTFQVSHDLYEPSIKPTNEQTPMCKFIDDKLTNFGVTSNPLGGILGLLKIMLK